MSGQLGIIRMNVAGLHKASKTDRQHTEKTQNPESARARFVSVCGQTWSYDGKDRLLQSCAMHHVTPELLPVLQPEKFSKTFGLGAADGDFALLLVVHAQLVGTLEPGDDFFDAIDIHQERTVRAPEKIRIKTV